MRLLSLHKKTKTPLQLGKTLFFKNFPSITLEQILLNQMKNKDVLPVLIIALFISCDKDDNGINSPAGGTNNKVSFVYNGKW